MLKSDVLCNSHIEQRDVSMSNVYVEPRRTIEVPKLVEDDEHRPVNKPVDPPKPDPVKVDDPTWLAEAPGCGRVGVSLGLLLGNEPVGRRARASHVERI
jgi:hypothetical protein